jgi:putative heme-binding domain-containing protein
MRRTFAVTLAAATCTAGVALFAQRGGGAPQGPPNPFAGNPQAVSEGREAYNRECLACHGPDGAAGEMGPALGAPARRYAQASDAQIFEAIKSGVPNTLMPPFSNLPDDEIWKMAAYIRALRGTAIDAPSPGDVAAGEQVFWNKGKCGDCHIVKGKGGLVGPELTNIAGLRKTSSIVDALTKEQHKVFGDGGAIPKILTPLASYQPVTVSFGDGRTIRGVVKNEDSYSLQVMGLDNQLHMIDRQKAKVVYESKSLMPTDYDKRLTPDELRNLLAFLTRLHVPAPVPQPQRGGPPPSVG